ncbi:uncharacterized protein [Henckelia pumila]|uniref:uncharacterized protein isoform X2 n=1 Tax=Henckelia pumila TaxID=405737 RepID=UPI003C6E8E86
MSCLYASTPRSELILDESRVIHLFAYDLLNLFLYISSIGGLLFNVVGGFLLAGGLENSMEALCMTPVLLFDDNFQHRLYVSRRLLHRRLHHCYSNRMGRFHNLSMFSFVAAKSGSW